MIIDAHGHIWPEVGAIPSRHTWISAMNHCLGRLPGELRDPKELWPKIAPGWVDPDGSYLLKNMRESGIDMTTMWVPGDYGPSLGQEQEFTPPQVIERFAELQNKYPNEILAAAYMDPRRVGAFEHFKRGIEELGLKGLGEVHPRNGYFIHDRMWYPFYDLCTDREVPVLVCVMCSFGGPHRQRHCDPIYVGDVAADFPDMTIILGHAGWPFKHWFEECLAVAGMNLNVYIQFDLWMTGYRTGGRPCAWPSIDTDEREIVRMVIQARDFVGAQRILWGSDSTAGPRFDGPKSAWGFGLKRLVDWWKDLPETAEKYGFKITREEVDLILGGNAARIFKLVPKPKLMEENKYGWKIRYPAPQ